MTSRRAPRLVDAAEIAAEHGITPSRVSSLYNNRAENGFPEIAGMRGRARLWDQEEEAAWFANRPQARLRTHTPPTRDPQDLLTAAESSRFLGYKNPIQVTNFMHDHPGYFPEPDVVEELGTAEHPYRRQLWRVQTLLDWMATRPGRGKRTGVQRTAPALPEVPRDGDPDELHGATQAAALLGFKSVNSFSSSLSQGNLPLLETPDAITDKGGYRRWTLKRILEQDAQRRARTRQ